MSIQDVIRILGTHNGRYFRPYDPRNVLINAGAPPVKLDGWNYVFAQHNKAQRKRFSSLGGGGCWARNSNTSGTVEIGFLQGHVSIGALEVLDTMDISIPFVVVDTGTGGTSGFVASNCRRVETPQWRREKLAGITIFTFETKTLDISWGLQLPEED